MVSNNNLRQATRQGELEEAMVAHEAPHILTTFENHPHSTWRIVKNVVGFSRLGGGLCLSGTHSHIDVDLNDT